MIRVLIVDDQPVVRHGLKLFLTNYDDINVIGESDSGPSAVLQSRRLTPDVILMDIRMPNGDGLAAAREIILQCPSQKIIIITTFGHDGYLYTAIDIGVSGFLLKNSGPDELAQAIYTAHKGGTVIAPSLLSSLAREFGRRAIVRTQRTSSPKASDDLLTTREHEIIHCLARGLSNDEIAEELHVEVSTIKTHLNRISNKVGTKSRLQTTIWAYRSGVVDVQNLDIR
ncbi:hypothetical protein BS297_24150 [Rhodococcus erythropolis]|uniref:DNA-binding response regulator n=1 Tax=Rhodococcus erythropolis TaxID=1833 RepID=A0A5N5DX75_RHOER|nr:hypothetical protein BS297_24150 [Rhodococcus erythropolis]